MYDIPSGNLLECDFNSYPQTDGAALAIDFGADNIGIIPLPETVSGFRIPWRVALERDREIDSGWNVCATADISVSATWQAAAQLLTELGIGWREFRRMCNQVRSGWGSMAAADARIRVLWSLLRDADIGRGIPWDALLAMECDITSPYRFPPPRDEELRLPYAQLKIKDSADLEVAWLQPPPQDRLHSTCWGEEYYERICVRKYEIPAGNMLECDFRTPMDDVGDGDHCTCFFESLSYDERCSQREPSGWRDAYTYVPGASYKITPILPWYLFMNSMALIKVDGGANIAIRDGSVSIDFGSWCWGLEATVSNESSYLAVKPTIDGTVRVQLTVNGYHWLFEVEDAEETIRYGQRSWRISGRSISAELASPVAPVKSYVETQQCTAVQLMEDAILNTGWTIDFHGVDWMVAANALSYADKTPLEVVQMIAGEGGCRVQSAPDSKVLRIIPRYNGSPWSWAATTPALAIHESIVRSFGHSWQPGPGYNGVYVSGTTQGVLCFVKRTGTDGALLAPMVTGPLITDTDVARERGRTEIAASASYTVTAIDLPLEVDPAVPGILLPGAIIEVIESRETWRGQVTGCKISGARNRGLVIRQNIEVERYHGSL